MSSSQPSQIAHIPFVGGIDEHTDPRLVQNSQLRELKNGRIDKPGRVSKRYGMTNVATTTYDPLPWGVPSSGVLSSGHKVHTLLDQVVVVDGQHVRALTGSTLNAVGVMPETTIDKTPIVSVQANQLTGNAGAYNLDFAVTTTHYVCMWLDGQDTGQAWLLLRDRTTGAVTMQERISASNLTNPRVMTIGGVVFFAVQVVASGDIQLWTMPTATTFSFVVTLAAAAKTQTNYEIATDGTNVFVLYQTGANYDLTLASFTTAGAAVVAPTLVGEADTAKKDAFAFVVWDKIYLTYTITTGLGTGNALRFAVANKTTLANVVAPADLHKVLDTIVAFSGLVGNGATDVHAVWSGAILSGNNAPFVMGAKITSGGALTKQTVQTYWCTLQTKPFRVGGLTYAWVLAGAAGAANPHWTASQGIPVDAPCSYILCDTRLDALATLPASLWRPVGVTSTRQARGLVRTTKMGQLPQSVVSISANGDVATFLRTETDNNGAASLDMVAAKYVDTSRGSMAASGSYACLSGGYLGNYDGARFAENGFLYDPYCAVSIANSNVGSMVPGEKYAYKIVYAWQDAAGQTHRSCPSYGSPGADFPVPGAVAATSGNIETFAVVGAGKSSLDLVFPCYTLTGREYASASTATRNQWIEIYRTTDIQTTVSDVFYYLTRIPNNAYNATVAWTDTGNVWGWASGTDNQRLASHAKVYTYGGIVPNVCTPSVLHVCEHKGRIFAIEKDRLWFTKAIVDGEAPAFADEFTFSMPGAELVGLASLDDKLVIFGKSRIWALFGDGPNDTLTVNDYSQPIPLCADVGCLDARSIVVHPGGVAFKSQTGIQSLSRNLQLEFIGEAVVDSTDAHNVCAAVIQPTQHVMHFALEATEPAQVLVYDYHHNVWSRDTHVSPVYSMAVSRTGVLYKLAPGALSREDTSVWKDQGAWVTLAVSLNWFQPTGLQGFSRVRKVSVLGEYLTAHAMSASLYTNYRTVTADHTEVYTSTAIAAKVDADSGLWEQEITINSPLVRSSSLIVTDADPGVASDGSGSRFIGVAIEFTPESGLYRKPDNQKG